MFVTWKKDLVAYLKQYIMKVYTSSAPFLSYLAIAATLTVNISLFFVHIKKPTLLLSQT